MIETGTKAMTLDMSRATIAFFRDDTAQRVRTSNTNIYSLGQATMQAVRPKILLAPLHIRLGVPLHNHFASKFLIDVLNSM